MIAVAGYCEWGVCSSVPLYPLTTLPPYFLPSYPPDRLPPPSFPLSSPLTALNFSFGSSFTLSTFLHFLFSPASFPPLSSSPASSASFLPSSFNLFSSPSRISDAAPRSWLPNNGTNTNKQAFNVNTNTNAGPWSRAPFLLRLDVLCQKPCL